MCGISCVVTLSKSPHATCSTTSGAQKISTNVTREQLRTQFQQSLDYIKHRGPDGQGVWISQDDSVGLAHCRLAINDLRPAAVQPLHSSDGLIHAVVNGEIYDFDRLRAELSSQYDFNTYSDSEVVVALYQQYGHPNFLKHLRGEFAICIYDERKQLFIAVRDRYGIKPLFWTVFQNRLLVAAEVKAFLGLGWKAEWDVQSITEAGWDFDDRTLFQTVRKIKPGTYLTCTLENGNLGFGRYWDSDFPDKNRVDPRPDAELIQDVRAKMIESVRHRLRADVPVGIYLSGGIDSSALAGIASHLVRTEKLSMGISDASKRVCCFSIAFDQSSGFDESEIAQRTADFLDVDIVKLPMGEEALAKAFEDATWHCEQPNPDLNYIGKFKLSEIVREKGYKVVLTGEGADEIYAGYPGFLPDYLREADRAFPPAISTLDDETRIRRCIEADAAVGKHYSSFGVSAPDRTSKRPLNNISTPISMCAYNIDCFASWVERTYPQSPLATITRAVEEGVRLKIDEHWHPLHAALYVWSKGHLQNLFLSCLGDRTEMAHSVEARPAFLDHHLTEYVNGLPPSTKIRYVPEDDTFVEKWIQRQAARPFITDELYKRKKHPYTAPIKYRRGDAVHALIERLCAEERIDDLGFIDSNKVKELIGKAFDEGNAAAFRTCLTVAQFTVIGERFNIDTAIPPARI